MVETVGDMVRSSMRKAGVLAAGEPLPPEEGGDALELFATMVDAWSLEALLIPTVNVVTHTLVSGIAEYTIGIYPSPQPIPLPSNHIETARPQKIISMLIRDSAGTDFHLRTMEAKQYALISRKTTEARPSRMYMRDGWPLNTILFDTVPYADETLIMEVIQPLHEILPVASLTEVVNLPPGYKKVLIDNLAVEIAPEWQQEVSKVVAVNAVQGKKRIKSSNYRDIVLRVDRALSDKRKGYGRYNITSDN
jgi:hypothetical protein